MQENRKVINTLSYIAIDYSTAGESCITVADGSGVLKSLSISSLLTSSLCSYVSFITGNTNFWILLARFSRPPAVVIVAISQITAQDLGLKLLVLAISPISGVSIRRR